MGLRQIVCMLLCCVLSAAMGSGCSRPKQATTVDYDLGERKKAPRPVAPQSPEPQQREKEVEPARQRSPEPEPQPERQPNGSRENGNGGNHQTERGSGAESSTANDDRAGTTDVEPNSGNNTAGPEVAPAFPGRPTAKSGRSPEAAAEAARRSLNLARAAVKRGDPDTAAREAITAYETAAEHAKSDAQCSEILGDADRLLEAIGRRQHPQDVPTRFE